VNILFLCIANSIRSQMAEGLARSILGEGFTIFSAGISPSFVHPMAIKVMAEINIDISKQKSKLIFRMDLKEIDKVVILCKNEVCPSILSKMDQEHWPLPNPVIPSDEKVAQLKRFREVRDLLIERINELKIRLQHI
jgi:arsenate reductase (thioredoxin)